MLKSLLTVSGFTLLSRILGFIRDMIVSHYLGGGAKFAAWGTAFRLPNLFRRIFGEGAFNSAFVPMYSGKLEEDGKGAASRFAGNIILLLAIVLSVICIILFFTMKWVVLLLIGGASVETQLLATDLSKITVSYLFFICMTAAVSGILNSHKKFAAPALAYVLLNVVFITALTVFVTKEKGNAAHVLSWSVFAAGFVQLGVVVLSSLRAGIRLKFAKPVIDADAKKLVFLMIPGLFSASIQQLNLIVSQLIASFQHAGAGFSYTYYADRVNQLPLGIIGIAFGMVLLPDLTQKLKSKKFEEAKDSLETGMTMAMFVAIPAMVGMAVLAEPIIFGIFKGGAFTAEQARLSGQALMVFALGCPAYIMTRVVQPGYFARENTKTPMKFTIISALTNIILCGVAWLVLDHDYLHIGCAAATTVAGYVLVFLLLWGLRKEEFIRLSKTFWSKLGRMLIASLGMGLLIYFVGNLLEPQLTHPSKLIRLSVLALLGSTGVFLYFTIAYFIKAMTPRELKAGFRR